MFWFTNSTIGHGVIGIIMKEDQITKEKFLYIGYGLGKNKNEDIKNILEWGTKISLEHALTQLELLK